MAKRKTTFAKIIDKKHFGDEPKLVEVTSRSDLTFSKALTWYSSMYGSKEAKEFLLTWMKQKYTPQEISALRRIKDSWTPTTAGWIARMHLNGTKFSSEIISIVHTKIEQAIVKYSNETDEDVAVRVKGEEEVTSNRVTLLQNKLLEMTEALIDDWMNGGTISFYDFLKTHNVSKQNAEIIMAYYKPISEDLNSNDPQLKEAYGKKLSSTRKFYDNIISDVERFIGNKKIAAAPRKPRAKKVVPTSKLVANVKYQKEDISLKVQSSLPENLIGAKQVWLFNTKYRKLAVVNSESGLSVKGTTLVGFDETTSKSKTLRKPEEQLSQVLSLAKVPLKKFFADIKSAESNFNGRLNENTIIIRVLK